MGGFFGVASKEDCVFDLFFGTDYHSHLGTRRAGLAVYEKGRGFDRSIHNIENAPFRTKFDKEVTEMKGNLGIGSISDYEPQPLIVRHSGQNKQYRGDPVQSSCIFPHSFSGNERRQHQRHRACCHHYQSKGKYNRRDSIRSGSDRGFHDHSHHDP